MGAKLQALLDLQDIELQIVDIQSQLARKERRVAAQTRKLQAAREAIEVERADIQRAQIQFDELDLQIKSRSSAITRLREQLNSVKTNKEYAALLGQMNNEKADVTRFEERALEMMSAIDKRKEEFAEQQKNAESEDSRLNTLTAELEQTRTAVAERLAALRERRKQGASGIDPTALKLFDRLSERYEGEIMADVNRPNPRRDEFVCGGCHMSLRPEAANALRIRDEVITCKNCGRILFVRTDK